MEGIDPQELLRRVAEAVSLREGPEGVRAIVRAVFDNRQLSTRDLARIVRLPLPVVAAVRGELTERGIFVHGSRGAELGPMGFSLAESLFGAELPGPGEVSSPRNEAPAAEVERPDPLNELFPKGEATERSFAIHLQAMAKTRPDADVTLDQAKATPDTLARRAAYLAKNDLIAGRSILCLGDDDFTSRTIAEWCAWQSAYGVKVHAGRVMAVDIDKRILDTLSGHGGVEVRAWDARDPLPEDLRGAFDVVVTDPPYTPQGAELFLSRALQAVGSKPGAHCVFCFGHSDPDAMRQVQSAISEMGWVITEWLPGFNKYEGAGVLGGISLLAHLIVAEGALPVVEGKYAGSLYTADLRPVTRIYRCGGCRARWEVGAGTRWQTVAELKRTGCPECGADTFRRIAQRSDA